VTEIQSQETEPVGGPPPETPPPAAKPEPPPPPPKEQGEAKAESKASDTADDKERNREGYAQRKLKEAEEQMASLTERVAKQEREIAVRDAMAKHGLGADDLELIYADTADEIAAKAEKLAARYAARGDEAATKAAEKAAEGVPPFFKRTPAEAPPKGDTVEAQLADLRSKL